jgi:hypothetical protein
MAIDFNRLKNNCWNMGIGALCSAGAVLILNEISKAGFRGYPVKVIKDHDTTMIGILALMAFEVTEIIFADLGFEDNGYRLAATMSISLISVCSLAYAANAGHKLSAYLFTSLVAALAGYCLLLSAEQFSGGARDLLRMAVGRGPVQPRA